jgi:hypothetical protein
MNYKEEQRKLIIQDYRECVARRNLIVEYLNSADICPRPPPPRRTPRRPTRHLYPCRPLPKINPSRTMREDIEKLTQFFERREIPPH